MTKIRCYKKNGRVIYYSSPDDQYHWVIENEWSTFMSLKVPHAPTTIRGTFAQCQSMLEQFEGENK